MSDFYGSVHFRSEWEKTGGNLPPIDVDAFDELTDLAGGDDDFLRDLLETYFEQTRTLLAEGRTAASRGSGLELVRAVHTLNGSSRNVGAFKVARLCAAFERDADAIGDAVQLAPLLDLLREPVLEACAALREHLKTG